MGSSSVASIGHEWPWICALKSLQGASLGKGDTGRQAVAYEAGPPSPRPWCNLREGQEPIQLGCNAVAGVARTTLKSTTNSSSGFLLGVYEAFPEIGYGRKAARFDFRVFLIVDELPTKLTNSICPTILQYPPDFVTVRTPLYAMTSLSPPPSLSLCIYIYIYIWLYAIGTQGYMLMIVSCEHKDKEVSKHRPVTAIAMQPLCWRHMTSYGQLMAEKQHAALHSLSDLPPPSWCGIYIFSLER